MATVPIPQGAVIDPQVARGVPIPHGARIDEAQTSEPEPDQFAKDRAITEAWAHNHKILGPIARFLVAGGQNAASAITDTPSFLYHAITDPATPEESSLSPEQRVIARLGVEQAAKAGISYASGEVKPKAALSVLPEALGTGLGQVSGGAVYGKMAGTASDVATSAISKGKALWDAIPEDIQADVQKLAKQGVGVASPRLRNLLDAWATGKKVVSAARNVEKAGPAAQGEALPAESATRQPAVEGITPQGWYYLGRMQEIARSIEEAEATAAPKNVTPSRAAALKNPVTPAASSDDLTNLLQESLKRAKTAKGKPLEGSLADLQ